MFGIPIRNLWKGALLLASVQLGYAQTACDVLKPLTVRISGGNGDGAGLIVANDGQNLWIATSGHVVAGKSSVDVYFWDAQLAKVPATVEFRRRAAEDEMDDVALLKVMRAKRPAQPPVFPLRSGPPVFGERVSYAGHPYELPWQCYPPKETISRLDFSNNPDLILFTDPVLQPGLSGGPLSDEAGNVLGIIYGHTQGANSVAVRISVVLSWLKEKGVTPSQSVVLSIEISKKRTPNSELNGTWQGKLVRKLIDGDDAMGFNADLTFNGPDFAGAAFEIKFTVLQTSLAGKLEGNQVHFTQSYQTGLDQIRHTAVFDGKLDRASQTIEGKWTGDAANNERQETGTFLLRLNPAISGKQ